MVRILPALIFLLYMPAGLSRAAEIHVHPNASDGIAVIVLRGEVLADDGAQFARHRLPIRAQPSSSTAPRATWQRAS